MRGIIIFIGVLLVGIIGYNVAWFGTGEEIEITVTDKERIVESSGSGEDQSVESKYLVFTEDETFENTDVTLLGKWNSSDVQGQLRVDRTYRVKVYGWRIGFFSMYRNITEIIEEVEVEEPEPDEEY
jgi:hypothetical protein